MALLAGAACLTLLYSTQTASLDDEIRRVEYLDGVMRHTARRSGNAMQIDLDMRAGVMSVCEETTGGSAVSAVQMIKFSHGLQLERVWSALGDEAGQSEGDIQIPCSSDGYTPSYALQLLGPSQQRKWIIIAGLTGEASELPDEQHVRGVWKMMRQQVPDSGDGGNTRGIGPLRGTGQSRDKE